MIEECYVSTKDSLVSYKEYYKNGQLMEEGLLKKRHYHGYWKMYYPDGVVKWQGEYDFGRFLIMRDYDSTFFTKIKEVEVFFENDVRFMPGKQAKFRTIIKDVHPKLYCIYAIDTASYVHLLDRDIEESYPYSMQVDSLFIKEEKGYKIMDLLFVFAQKNGVMDPEKSPTNVFTFPVYDDTMVVKKF